MFEERSVRQCCTQLRLTPQALVSLLADRPFSDVIARASGSKWTLQGLRRGGEFKALLNGITYNLRFLVSASTNAITDETEFLLEASVYVLYAIAENQPSKPIIPAFIVFTEAPFELKSKDMSRKMMLVSEYCMYTDLSSFIDTRLKAILSTDGVVAVHRLLLSLTLEICRALQFMHREMRMAHGALCLNNVRVAEDCSPRLVGFSKCFRFDEQFEYRFAAEDVLDLGCMIADIAQCASVPDHLLALGEVCRSEVLSDRPSVATCVELLGAALLDIECPAERIQLGTSLIMRDTIPQKEPQANLLVGTPSTFAVGEEARMTKADSSSIVNSIAVVDSKIDTILNRLDALNRLGPVRQALSEHLNNYRRQLEKIEMEARSPTAPSMTSLTGTTERDECESVTSCRSSNAEFLRDSLTAYKESLMAYNEQLLPAPLLLSKATPSTQENMSDFIAFTSPFDRR